MDEAERCHRLAFIFSGRLLDEGRPDEIIARRHLDAAHIEVDDLAAAEQTLEARPEIESVEPYGTGLRIVSHDADALAVAGDAVGVRRGQPTRVRSRMRSSRWCERRSRP
jgi:ABC-2 type transport system ATP-binding protein